MRTSVILDKIKTKSIMNPILRNVLAVVAGIFIGGAVNMAIVSIAPLPEGVDPNDIQSIKANIETYSTGNLILPIIAHALGTLVGAFAAAKLAATGHKMLALTVGAFFLLGGIYMVYLIPEAPMWMKTTDVLLAYIPMSWIGWNLAGSK